MSLQQRRAEEQLRCQCEELRASNQQELQQVQEALARLQQDSKQKLLQAESQKQQVCSADRWRSVWIQVFFLVIFDSDIFLKNRNSVQESITASFTDNHYINEIQYRRSICKREKPSSGETLCAPSNSHAQALSQKEMEKTALGEQVAALQQEVASAGMELERAKREALCREEQNKVEKIHSSINELRKKMKYSSSLGLVQMFPSLQNGVVDLQSELCKLRTQLEESLNSHEDATRRLSEQVGEFSQQRERAQQEVRRRAAASETQLHTTGRACLLPGGNQKT